VAITIPILTPESVGAPPQARPVFQNGEDAAARAQGAQAVAAATEKAGNTLEQVSQQAARAKEEVDQGEVMARINDLGEWKNQQLDNEALKTDGKNALGVTDRTLKDYDSAVQALDGTLSNGYQKKLFAQHAAQDRVIVQRQLLLHEHDQLDKQQEIDFRSGLDRFASDAGLRWQVPGSIDTSLSQGEAALVARGQTQGWSPEQLTKEQRDFRSRVVASVVNNAVARPEDMGSAYARAILDRYSTLTLGPKGQVSQDTGKLIDGDVVKQLAGSVRAASIRDVARLEVDRITAAVPPDRVSGIADISKQVDLARKTVKNSDALPEVESQLREIWNLKNADRAKNDEANAHSMILGLDEDAQKLKPLAVNKADPRWQAMTDTGRATVMQHLLALQGTERHERDQALQIARYDFFSRPPAERARVNPVVEYPQLDRPGQQAIQKLVLDAQTAWNKDNGATSEAVHASVRDAADSMRYSKKQLGQFSAAVEARLARDFPKKDQPPSTTDVNRVIADELLFGRSGTWWNGAEARWEAEVSQHGEWKPAPANEQRFEPSKGLVAGAIQQATQRGPVNPLDAIPPGMRDRIDGALKRQGNNNPTDADRLRLWQTLQQRQRGNR
jgi:hypothetical protein